MDMTVRDFTPDACELPTLMAWVRGVLAQAGRPGDRATLVIEELASNVIHHGGLVASSGPIMVGLAVAPEGVEVVFEDGGAAFDPGRVRAVADPREAPGGQGLALIRALPDRLDYQRIGDRNRLLLWFCSKAEK